MKRILLPALALLLAGCATLRPQPPLRVGVTPDYPPIIMKDSYGTITGLEVDFAKHLAGEMGRSLELVVVPWSEQVPALLRAHGRSGQGQAQAGQEAALLGGGPGAVQLLEDPEEVAAPEA